MTFGDENITGEIPTYTGNVTGGGVAIKGDDGFSPIVSVEAIEGGHRVSITDAEGIDTFELKNGTDGKDGKSAYEYAKEGGYSGTEAEFAQKIAKEIPSKTSDLANDSGFIKTSEAPVQSVNKKTGAVSLSASDVGARPSTWTPNYTDVGADKSGTASSTVSTHNTNTGAHNDIRLELKALSDRINAALDSDDTTLDELSEIVAYIKANKALIDGVTTSKVNVSDIINNLVTNVTNKPLSAAQGVALKALINAITVPTKTSELTNDSGFLTSETDPTVPSWAKQSTKPSYSKSEVGLGNVDNVKQYSASNPPPYPVTSVNGQTGVVTGLVETKNYITLVGVDADGITHTYTIYGVEGSNSVPT